MTSSCVPLPPWPLSRRGQDLIAWDVSGLPAGASASLQLEGAGTWYPLMISTARDMISVMAAGPLHPAPATGTIIVPTTSHTEIRVQTGPIDVYLDGGYIELLP